MTRCGSFLVAVFPDKLMCTCGVDVTLVEGLPVGGLNIIPCQSLDLQPSIGNAFALL